LHNCGPSKKKPPEVSEMEPEETTTERANGEKSIQIQRKKIRRYLYRYESGLLLVSNIQRWKVWIFQVVRVHLKIVSLH